MHILVRTISEKRDNEFKRDWREYMERFGWRKRKGEM